MTPLSARGLRLAGPLILLGVALAVLALALPRGAQGQEGEGTLTVVKVGAPSTANFNIEVTEGEDMTPVDNIIVAGGDESSATLPAGEYTLSELESQDYVLQGWALAPSVGACPAAPTTTDGLFDVEVTADVETVVCVFNQADVAPGNEHTYTLHFRWTIIAWLGEDGIPVEDAITGEGDNAGGTDVSDDVLSIWYWVAEDQSWLAYFSGDTTGASDLETLERFESYWVAIDDDNDPVTWTIRSTVTDIPGGHPSLEAAMQAYVEGRGEEYSGDCEDADVEDDIGTWCSIVVTSSADSAEVGFGPVFSEVLVVVTFERQSDGTWLAVDERDPDEEPTGTVTETETETGTPSVTETATNTPTATSTATATGTATTTETGTPSATETGTPSATETGTETATETGTATATETGTPAGTATVTGTTVEP